MKITIVSKNKLTSEHKNIIKLLELDDDFERLVWQARVALGVQPIELEVTPKLKTEIVLLYQKALNKRPQKPNYNQLNEYFDYLEESGKKTFRELIELGEDKENIEKFERMDKMAGEYFELLSGETSKIMNQYASLPRSWEHAIERFLLSGELYLEEEIEPIVLHFDIHTVRNLKKIPYPSEEDNKKYYKNPVGLQITLTGKVSRRTIDKWLDEHWKEIETLMQRIDLPEHWSANIRTIDFYKQLGRMKNKGKKSYGELADDLSSTDKNENTYDETSLSKGHSRLKKYILRLKTGQKVT